MVSGAIMLPPNRQVMDILGIREPSDGDEGTYIRDRALRTIPDLREKMRWPFDGFRHVREHLIAFYPLPNRNVAPHARRPVRPALRLSPPAVPPPAPRPLPHHPAL